MKRKRSKSKKNEEDFQDEEDEEYTGSRTNSRSKTSSNVSPPSKGTGRPAFAPLGNPFSGSPFQTDGKFMEQLKQTTSQSSFRQTQLPNKPIVLPSGFTSACEWAETQFVNETRSSLPMIGQQYAPSSTDKPTEIVRHSKISAQEVEVVKELVEKCLGLYMNQSEFTTVLQSQANIHSTFSNYLLQKLEEENLDFFKAYNVRMRIKEQVTAFNYLVSQQAQLMQRNGLLQAKKVLGQIPLGSAIPQTLSVASTLPPTGIFLEPAPPVKAAKVSPKRGLPPTKQTSSPENPVSPTTAKKSKLSQSQANFKVNFGGVPPPPPQTDIPPVQIQSQQLQFNPQPFQSLGLPFETSEALSANNANAQPQSGNQSQPSNYDPDSFFTQ